MKFNATLKGKLHHLITNYLSFSAFSLSLPSHPHRCNHRHGIFLSWIRTLIAILHVRLELFDLQGGFEEVVLCMNGTCCLLENCFRVGVWL